jgi:hypothetical protein
MANELKKHEPLKAIDTALAACASDKLRDMTLMERTVTLAGSMATMRENFSGTVLESVKGLADTPLGFLTDRAHADKPYPDNVVRDCVIEAMLRGAQPIGNEFNIIAGRCYLTKAFFERQLRVFPGLTELRVIEGVPQTAQQAGGALVPIRASWKLHGKPDELNCVDDPQAGDSRIAVRVNAGMGVDAILGKAKRKLLARIFARVTGSDWVDTESEVGEEMAVETIATAVDQVEADSQTLAGM